MNDTVSEVEADLGESSTFTEFDTKGIKVKQKEPLKKKESYPMTKNAKIKKIELVGIEMVETVDGKIKNTNKKFVNKTKIIMFMCLML